VFAHRRAIATAADRAEGGGAVNHERPLLSGMRHFRLDRRADQAEAMLITSGHCGSPARTSPLAPVVPLARAAGASGAVPIAAVDSGGHSW
jgi:hypothetical protein